MTEPVCTCPKITVNGEIVRAYLDAKCPVHGREIPIVQTPDTARMQQEKGEK